MYVMDPRAGSNPSPFAACKPSPFAAPAAPSHADPPVQVTVHHGACAQVLKEAPPKDHGFSEAPAPGDCTTPNNFIPLEDSNTFCANVRVTMGGQEPQGSKSEAHCLPDKVKLTTLVTCDHLIYSLEVEVTNPLPCVAAAVLDVPRLPGLLLLEEEHRVGDVHYAPQVMEKAQADAAYRQAAASETHSATLGAVEESSFSVNLDKVRMAAPTRLGAALPKSGASALPPPPAPARSPRPPPPSSRAQVPPGATATFGVKLLQSGGVRSFGAVVSDADAPAAALADFAVLPAFAPLDVRSRRLSPGLACSRLASLLRDAARRSAAMRLLGPRAGA